MRGATWTIAERIDNGEISIHAPHARSDIPALSRMTLSCDFNPRSSCEERQGSNVSLRPSCNFNPRSSCEERRVLVMGRDDDKPFQSTLLMRGATVLSICRCMVLASFQSTLLMRGATRPLARFSRPTRISIHAPHARSDVSRFSHFCSFTRFQSTLLMRGATVRQVYVAAPRSISIHAPHARSDPMTAKTGKAETEFQSTLLMRGATPALLIIALFVNISIHAPHARSDCEHCYMGAG